MRIATVIPAWNRADTIGRAIASAIAQTLPPEEIIVVDDGSDDETRDVVSHIAETERRVRLITLESRGGACKARNAGVAASKADWIAFLDSDDIWLPSKLETQVRAMHGKESVACFTGMYRGTPPKSFLPPAHVTLESLRFSNVLGSTSTALVSREAFESAGGFDESLPSCQDWDLWLRLAATGPLSVCRVPLVTYDTASSNRISSNRQTVLSGHAVVFGRVLSGVTDPGERRRISAMHHRRLSEIHEWDLGSQKDALRHAVRSFMLSPSLPLLMRIGRIASRCTLNSFFR